MTHTIKQLAESIIEAIELTKQYDPDYNSRVTAKRLCCDDQIASLHEIYRLLINLPEDALK